mgnify:CR=1 FL=1
MKRALTSLLYLALTAAAILSLNQVLKAYYLSPL